MSKPIEFIKALVRSFKSEKDQDSAYLSEAVDVYDLERRMREIDFRAKNASGGHTCGFGAG
jgi:hypothetical protein